MGLNRWAWRLLAAEAAVLLAVFALFRIAFLVLYRGDFAADPLREVLISLLAGERFDASVLAAYMGLPALAFLALSPWRRRRAVYWVQFALVAVLALAMCVLMSVDLFYYAFVGRRVSFEVVAMANDFGPIAGLIVKAYLLPTVSILALLFGLLALAIWRFARLAARPWMPVGWLSHGVQVAAFAALLLFAARGGAQVKPLSENMAFRTGNLALGHLSLNAVFTATKALGRRQTELHLLPEPRALAVTEHLLGLPAAPLRPGYPLWRRAEVPPVPRPLNLVVIVIESFSPQMIGMMGGEKGVSDHFEALTREGMFFPEFYASGTRSLEGIGAVITGYPALPHQALIGSSLEQNGMTSLSGVLKAHGYHTLFLHGAYRGSMWFDHFAARHGFDRYIAKEDFPDPKGMSDSTWGIFDHYALERLHQELEQSAKPVFAFFFSLSSHTPYELPGPNYAKFPDSTPGAKVLNSFAYTDYALGRFFELARHSSYWDHTVFFITGDHNMGGPFLNRRESMHIPLLILNPGDPKFPKGAVNETLGSQISIAPTALQLLGISAGVDFPAPSLLAPAPRRFALFAWGGTAGWMNETSLVVHDLTRPLALYHWRDDPRLTKNLAEGQAPAVTADDPAVVDFAGYLQTVNNLLIQNRVSPRDAPP